MILNTVAASWPNDENRPVVSSLPIPKLSTLSLGLVRSIFYSMKVKNLLLLYIVKEM